MDSHPTHKLIEICHRRRWILNSFPECPYDEDYITIEGGFEGMSILNYKERLYSWKQYTFVCIKFLYLNPLVSFDEFCTFGELIVNKNYGYIYGEHLDKPEYALTICDDIYNKFNDGDLFAPIEFKKIIFNRALDSSERMRIIGTIFKKSIMFTESAIKEAVEELKTTSEIINYASIAKFLGCSEVTIKVRVTEDIKKDIVEYNSDIRSMKKFYKVKECISELIKNSSDKEITITNIRTISNVRDSNIIKEVMESLKL